MRRHNPHKRRKKQKRRRSQRDRAALAPLQGFVVTPKALTVEEHAALFDFIASGEGRRRSAHSVREWFEKLHLATWLWGLLFLVLSFGIAVVERPEATADTLKKVEPSDKPTTIPVAPTTTLIAPSSFFWKLS